MNLNGPLTGATLKKRLKTALDFSGGLLILDYDRIRRVNTTVCPMTVTTVIGGGDQTTDAILYNNNGTAGTNGSIDLEMNYTGF